MIYSNRKYRYNATRIYKNITHCIFDLDGTIIDSEHTYHEAIRKLCKKYGKVYANELRKKLYGATDKEVCELMVKELEIKISPIQLEDELNMMYEMDVLRAPLHKGVHRLLCHLRDHSIPMAIATNSTDTALRLHLNTKPQIFSMFHHMVSVSDPEVYRGKPQPDIYLIAASRFPNKPKSEKCLVFEDSSIGACAAAAAGMQVVLTPHRYIQNAETENATIVLRDLLHFKPELFGLPPFLNDEDVYKTNYETCFCNNK